MIRRTLAWIANHFADTEWLALWRTREVQATRSAQRTERQAEGLHERVTVPDDGRAW